MLKIDVYRIDTHIDTIDIIETRINQKIHPKLYWTQFLNFRINKK